MKKLPEKFCIKCDQNNPLWKKYINWLNENYVFSSITVSGDDPNGYYGYNGNTHFSEIYMDSPGRCYVITLEQFLNEGFNDPGI